MPPGPELAAVLDSIDVTRLGGLDCVEVMRAQARQVSHEQARFMVAMAETGICDVGPDDALPRADCPDEFAADEIRAALAWTRSAADRQLTLAWDLTRRLPQVLDALDHGAIDVPRARVFSEWTAGLTDQQAQQVCDDLLPYAPALTTGQLSERVKRLAIAIDPDWARRRYEEAVRERRVVAYRNPDGTGNLCGYSLPANEVAASDAHIRALAKKIKAAGGSPPHRPHQGRLVPWTDRRHLHRPVRNRHHHSRAGAGPPGTCRGADRPRSGKRAGSQSRRGAHSHRWGEGSSREGDR
jgi:hypothetical protein